MAKCPKCSTTVELPVTFLIGNLQPVIQNGQLCIVLENNEAENPSNVEVGSIIEPMTNEQGDDKIEELHFFDFALNPDSSVLAGLTSDNANQAGEYISVTETADFGDVIRSDQADVPHNVPLTSKTFTCGVCGKRIRD